MTREIPALHGAESVAAGADATVYILYVWLRNQTYTVASAPTDPVYMRRFRLFLGDGVSHLLFHLTTPPELKSLVTDA